MASKTAQAGRCVSQECSQTRVPQGRSGRRKLDFGSQQFRGKSFFLDLSGYRHSTEVERELVARGGTIELSFKKGVRYLVTNRPRQKSQSPSTPSPGTPTTAHSAKSNVSQLVSPLTESPSSVDSRPKQQAPAYATRAQKLVQLSLEKQRNTAKLDIIAKAKEWKCKVIYLDDLLAELKKLRPLPQKDNQKNVAHPSRQAKVRTLRAPFLKVEDLSRAHRPLVYEAKCWPVPDPACSPKACPFDSPKHARVPHPHQGDHTPQPPPEGRDKRPGYCECCAVRFNDLNLHLGSAKHREYAVNDSNFATLDSLIAEGTSFSAFIAQVRAKKRAEPQNRAIPKEGRQRKPSPRKSPSRRKGKSPLKPPKKSPRKNSLSPRKDTVVLVTPPTSVQDVPGSKLACPAEAACTPSPSHPAAPKSPRTPKRAARRLSPSNSPDKIISLPEAVAQHSPVPPKVGALVITPVADTRGKTDTAVARTPTRTRAAVASRTQPERTPGFVTPDVTLGDVSPSAPPPTASGSKKQHKKASRIDQIADKLSQRASSGSPGERSELGQKRPLDEDVAVIVAANSPRVKRHHLGAKSPGCRQHNDQLASKTQETKQQLSPPLLDIESVLDCAPLTRVAALRTSPRKPDLSSDDLIPETPQKVVPAQDHGKASVLCNIQALLEQVKPEREAVGSKSGGPSTPSKVNSPIQRRSPQGRTLLSPGVRKSPRLVQRELERTRPRVSTKTECIRRFGPPGRDSLVVSFDLVTLGAVKRADTPLKSSVCGAIDTPPTHCPTNENATPEIGLQGVLPLRPRLAPMGLLRQKSSELSSDFVGFSPNSVKTALTEGVARSAGVVTRSMVTAEGCGSGERRIDEIALKLIAAAESKSQSGTAKPGNGKRCLEFDDTCSSPPAKRRRVNPSASSSPIESRRSPRVLRQQVFTGDSL